MASRGRIIIASLHQPSAAIFNSLDQVMVLAEGRQVYYGKPSNAASFLTYHGLPNPHNFPIAENLLEVAANKSLLDKLLESVNTKPPFGQGCWDATSR